MAPISRTITSTSTRASTPGCGGLYQIGKALVRAGILDDPEDIFMLKYDEIRCTATSNYPVRELVKTRREEMEAARKIHPQEWYGTATEWSVYQEPYKSLWGYPQKFEAEMKEKAEKTEISKTVLEGIPGCPASRRALPIWCPIPPSWTPSRKARSWCAR